MPTDTFVAELLEMPPEDAIGAFNRYLTECFTLEDRPTVVQQFVSSVWSLMAESDAPEMPQLMGLAEFLASVGDPPPAMVEGFLPANKLICFSGMAKEGKSLVAMQILADICRGGRMLNRFDVSQSGPVVYFEMEGGAFELKERLTKRFNVDDDGYYVCATPFDLNNDAGWGTFLSLIDQLPEQPSLVVIDSAREAYSSIRDWNDAALVGPALKRIRLWAHKHCTVILICHTNKDKFATGVNRVSGSGALVSSSDIVSVLTGQKVLENGDLRWDYEISGRGVKKATYKFQMNTDTLHVHCLDDDEASKAATEDSIKGRIATKRQILEYVKSLEYFTPMIISGAFNLSVQHARELLNEMVREGVLSKGMKVKEEGCRAPSQSYVFKKDYDGDIVSSVYHNGHKEEEEDSTVPGNHASSSSSQEIDEPPVYLKTFFKEEEEGWNA